MLYIYLNTIPNSFNFLLFPPLRLLLHFYIYFFGDPSCCQNVLPELRFSVFFLLFFDIELTRTYESNSILE